MELRTEDLPVTLQAFDLLDNKEIFIAEQVVNSQSDVDTFTKRYTGKLIKAKKAAVSETTNSYGTTGVRKEKVFYQCGNGNYTADIGGVDNLWFFNRLDTGEA